MSEDKTENLEVKGEEEIPARTRTQITVNAANIIDNADQQLFPSLYAQIQATTGLDIVQLGWVTGVRSFLQSVTTPLWGWWNDKHSRKLVLAFGCFFWAIFTTITAFGTQYFDILLYRALTGIGLAVIIPTSQSLIADYFPPAKRGKAFGYLGMTGVIGTIFGTLFATALVTDTVYILGIDAWRFVFIVWGVISAVLGFLVLLFAKDPIRGKTEPELAKTLTAEKAAKYGVHRGVFIKIFKTKTFVLIVLQGVVGTIPWNGILFMVIWLQYVGFDAIMAGLVFAIIAVGAALGNLLGGVLTDRAAKWRPKSGKIIIAQIAVFSGIPLSFVIFALIPKATESIYLFLVFGVITGLLISWNAPINNSIFSEIFEPEIRGTVYSVDRVFEGGVAAVGTVIVGVVAAFLGYVTPIGPIELLPPAVRYANMMALSQAMLWVAVIPWICCLIIYTFVYKTYPGDAEKIRTLLEQRRKELEN
jgi:MFS family permease